jgi:hypothetical protein
VTSQRGKDTVQQVEGFGVPCRMVNKVGALASCPWLLSQPLLLLPLLPLLRLLLSFVAEKEPASSRKRKRFMRSNGSVDTEGSCSFTTWLECATRCSLRVARCTCDKSTDLTPPLILMPLLLLPLLLL